MAGGGNDALGLAADEVCEELCENTADEGGSRLMDMCGNAGQESIIGTALDDFEELCMSCADGNGPDGDWGTDHDEAVGIIVDAGNEIIGALAAMCAAIQAAAAGGDLEDGGEGGEE